MSFEVRLYFKFPNTLPWAISNLKLFTFAMWSLPTFIFASKLSAFMFLTWILFALTLALCIINCLTSIFSILEIEEEAYANYEENRGFALYLMSVSQLYCPWLFVDIYMGKGHYNQGLKDNMLLFEMGSHLVEKDLVLKTVPELANVISVALFGEFEVSDNSTAKNTEIPTKSVETPIKNAENGLNDNNSINGSGTAGNDIQKIDDITQNGNDDIGDNDNINNENNAGKQGGQTIENGVKDDVIQTPTTSGVKKQNVVNANGNQSTIISGEKNIVIVLFVLGALTAFIVLASLSNRRK